MKTGAAESERAARRAINKLKKCEVGNKSLENMFRRKQVIMRTT